MIALDNAPGRLALGPKLFIPLLLAGWGVGVLLFPGPQDRLVRSLSLLAAAGGLAAFAGQFTGSLNLRSRYPPLIVVGGSLCVLLGVFCLVREPGWALVFRLALPLLLTGLVWFYTFYFSVFHGRERISRLQVRDRFPAFELTDSAGRRRTLPDILARGPALLVFYKGDW
jgi:hypothetical protein